MRPRRLKTFDYVGCYHYSLTFCTYRRNRYIEDPALVDRVAPQFSRTSAEHQIEELAYCYMPDHVHLLLAGLHDGASLLPCVEVMRQRSGRVAKASQGIRLWQDGFFERILRNDEQLEMVARYIFENHVRARLADTANQWHYSGGRLWESLYGSCPS